MFRHARGRQSGYQKEIENFSDKETPTIHNECLVDLQVDISDAKMLNTNCKMLGERNE